jgi:hypothetical protein
MHSESEPTRARLYRRPRKAWISGIRQHVSQVSSTIAECELIKPPLSFAQWPGQSQKLGSFATSDKLQRREFHALRIYSPRARLPRVDCELGPNPF